MRTTTSFMLSFALVAGLASPAVATGSRDIEAQARGRARAAQGQKPRPAHKPRNANDKLEKRQSRGVRNGRVFDRDGHVRVIRDFARRGLPPGLAKRETLPPGLRRQIRERGSLPPGLEKRLVPVPNEWSSRLPSIGRYQRRYFAGDDLIVVDTRANRIAAYIADILR
jgi:hypothetical protein